MPHKCALIVDDSRTARHFLARILQRHQIHVEMAASAEEALEFLAHERPDVIFMDHMMPGMDGFQAVSAIKSNPATATIPIMMYTSQSGELYVSQARALGAVGVLPKQIKPVEVNELLKSLHLVDAVRRQPEEAGKSRGAVADRQAEVDRMLRPADWDDLHRWLDEMLDHHGRSLRADLEKTVSRLLDSRLPPPEEPVVTAVDDTGSRAKRDIGARALIMVLAVLVVAAIGWQQYTRHQWSELSALNSELSAALEARRRADAESVSGLSDYLDAERAGLLRQYDDFLAALEWAVNQAGAYPPDGTPLDDARLDMVSGLLARLQAVGFSGVVQLQIHHGDFCLVPGDAGGWKLAAPDLPASSCARFGRPQPAGAAQAIRETVAFANFRAELERSGGVIQLVVEDPGDTAPLVPYPPTPQGSTAGEWNRFARMNNRVQIRLLPDTDLPSGDVPFADLR